MNTYMNTYIGIDIGTTSAKALLMDEHGTVLRTASSEYPLSTPQNGWAEQSPSLWWDAAIAAVREVLAGIDAANVRGVGLTGQMHGLVCLDEKDMVLRPAILWCDQRTAAECIEITEAIGEDRLIELTSNPALTGFTAPKILWMRNNEPELYNRISKIMLPKDYIRYKLTGEHATDVSDASGTGLLNVASRTWSNEVVAELKINASALPQLYESSDITGAVTSYAAELTGIPAGIPVVAGAGDNAAAAVGTGVARDGETFVTIGTSGVIFTHTARMNLKSDKRIHTFCSAVTGEWHVMGVTLAAGQSLKWFRENFAAQYSYAELDEIANAAAIGSNGLLFLPYLNGERSPHLDPDCRGAFIGLSTIHNTAELARAVMEGVVYSICDCRDVMTTMGVSLAQITACGGGGSSAFWRQMLADALDTSVVTAQTSEGPAFGAAILAAVGTGAYASVPEVCAAIIRHSDTQQPNAAATSEYNKYHAIYKSLYPALQSAFTELARGL